MTSTALSSSSFSTEPSLHYLEVPLRLHIWHCPLRFCWATHHLLAHDSSLDPTESPAQAPGQQDHVSSGSADRGGRSLQRIDLAECKCARILFPRLVLTALFGVLVPMDTLLGYVLTSMAVGWSTYSSGRMFVSVGGDKRIGDCLRIRWGCFTSGLASWEFRVEERAIARQDLLIVVTLQASNMA